MPRARKAPEKVTAAKARKRASEPAPPRRKHRRKTAEKEIPFTLIDDARVMIPSDVPERGEDEVGDDVCVDCGARRKLGVSAWLWPVGKQRVVVCREHRTKRQREAGLLHVMPPRQPLDLSDLVSKEGKL